MFDPALAGYWGAATFEDALETALAVINTNVAKVDGIKISLLDKDKEISDRWRGYKDIADSRHMANSVEREVVDSLQTAVQAAYLGTG